MMYNTYPTFGEKNLTPKLYTTSDGEYYIQLKVRLYLHFDPHNFIQIKPDRRFRLGLNVVPVHVSARSVVCEKTWTLKAQDAKNVAASDYLNIDFWQKEKQLMLKHYCDEVRRRYNVQADPEELSYMHQFCWEIECI